MYCTFFDGILLGRMNEFKLTAYGWCKLAHSCQKPFHYARVEPQPKFDTPMPSEPILWICPSHSGARSEWESSRLALTDSDFRRKCFLDIISQRRF